MILMLYLLLALSYQARAHIEDNSFLLEEAYNQRKGVFQFIQDFQYFENADLYRYNFENEIPLTDQVHQLSYEFGIVRADRLRPGEISDITINYRWQPYNKDGTLFAERFGLIVPTGRVQSDGGNGVFGLEFMQSATLTLGRQWMNHWNLGFNILPDAKTAGQEERSTLSTFTGGTSVIYLMRDDFNLMLEALIRTGQAIQENGTKKTVTSTILNPGVRWAWNLDWKGTQIVPGISFPTEVINNRTQHGILLYLSVEPKLY